MKVWTDKEGKQLTASEFMTRWKEGIQKVTPLQQIRSSLLGYVLIFAGIIWGIVLSAMTKQWWLFTILLGSFIITGTQVTAIAQRFILLKELEKEVQNNV